MFKRAVLISVILNAIFLSNSFAEPGDTSRAKHTSKPGNKIIQETFPPDDNDSTAAYSLSAKNKGEDQPDQKKEYIEFGIKRNDYPNPFCASSSLNYYIPFDSHVNVSLYNIMGQKVAELVNCEQQAGSHSIAINRPLQAGTYFYKLTFCETTLVQKLTILK
jgi:hypothetical protein